MRNKSLLAVVFQLAPLLFGLAFPAFPADFSSKMHKDMGCSLPFYLNRKNAEWAKHSRIIGEVRNPPKKFTIDICDASSKTLKILKTETFDENLTVYEIGWLGFGTYKLIYKSDDYITITTDIITIKPYTDCVINIGFGTTEYWKW